MRLTVSTAIILLAFAVQACSSNATPSTTAMPHAALQASKPDVDFDACTTAKIYVADYAKSDVEIYPQGVTNPSPCGLVKTGVSSPEAVYVDAHGKVYVSNYSPASVTEYKSGKETLSIPLAVGAFDIFVGTGGILYVAETAQDEVLEFKPGTTTSFLTVPVNGEPFGVATDSANDLYVSYLSNVDGVSHVEKFKPKATTGVDLGFTVGFAGELKLDTQNDIIIGDRNSSTIYVYGPGQTVPSRSFSDPLGKPVFLALDNGEANLYSSGQLAEQVFNYQAGTLTSSFSKGLRSPSGVALYPPAPY